MIQWKYHEIIYIREMKEPGITDGSQRNLEIEKKFKIFKIFMEKWSLRV